MDRPIKGPSGVRQGIVTLGGPPQRPDPGAKLRQRILEALETGGSWSQDGVPGARPWWAVRKAVGGRVNAVTFAQAVEELIAEGKVIEVWLSMPDRREPPHLLVLPSFRVVLRYPVARARGRPEVLALAPWSKELT